MQGSKISSKCWDVSQHCSVGSQKDYILKDPAVRKGRHRRDVKNRVLHSFLCMQLCQEAILRNSRALLCIISNYPYLQHTLLFWSWFSLQSSADALPMLTSFTSCQTGPHPGLPTGLFLTHLSRPAVQSATIILNLHLVSDLQSPQHEHLTPYTSNWSASYSTHVMPGLPKTERTMAPKYWLPKTFSSPFEGHSQDKKCC